MEQTQPLLQQKIEILEMQLDDYKYKNDNLKRMYEALQKAFEQESATVQQNHIEEEIKKLNENHSKDIQEQKKWHSNQIALLTTQNEELQSKIKSLVDTLQKKESLNEKQVSSLHQQMHVLENEKKEIQDKNKCKHKGKVDQVQITQKQTIDLERIEEQYKKDLEDIKNKSKQDFVQLEEIYATEKKELLNQIQKQNEISRLKEQKVIEQTRNEFQTKMQIQLNTSEQAYKDEIKKLKMQLKLYIEKQKEVQKIGEQKNQIKETQYSELQDKVQKQKLKIKKLQKQCVQKENELAELKQQNVLLVTSQKNHTDQMRKIENELCYVNISLVEKEKELQLTKVNQQSNLSKSIKQMVQEKTKLQSQVDLIQRQIQENTEEKIKIHQELNAKNQQLNQQSKQIQILKLKLKNLQRSEDQHKQLEVPNDNLEQRNINLKTVLKKNQQSQTEFAQNHEENEPSSFLPQIALSEKFDNSFANESHQVFTNESQARNSLQRTSLNLSSRVCSESPTKSCKTNLNQQKM